MFSAVSKPFDVLAYEDFGNFLVICILAVKRPTTGKTL